MPLVARLEDQVARLADDDLVAEERSNATFEHVAVFVLAGVRLPDPTLCADLRDYFHRWGCVTYVVKADVIEVIVPDASGYRQGRREVQLYLETWRTHHPSHELELID